MAKKKSGNKLAKDETEEERMVRLEMEALVAEEKGRKGVELARVSLCVRQQREQQYAHLNGIKIHNQWRKIMRLAKVEELRHEIEILSQNHEREVDGKDAAIQMLDRDLEEAEEQYQMAIRSHLVIVDSLLGLQYQRMRALEAEFNSDLRALQDEFDGERTDIANSHSRARKDLTDMMTAMTTEFTDAESDARQEYESAREEVKNRNSEEYNVLKIQLESIIDDLERHFEHAHKAYLESTEHRASAFKALTKNDAESARIIEQRMKKLVRMQEDLHHWRTKISASSSEWEARNGALRREKELMARHYNALKASLDAQRAAQAERLKALSVHSSAAIQELQQRLDKAETILKLAEMCRKLETEQEKVLPFHSPDEAVPLPGSKEQQQAEEDAEGRMHMAAEAGPSSSNGAEKGGQPRLNATGLNAQGHDVEEWDYLNLFFKRYNKALLDKSAIDSERQRLAKENGDLRQLLKQFLDGISVNDNVINNPANPLLVVNQRLQLAMAQRRQARAASANGAGGMSRPAGSAGQLVAHKGATLIGGLTGQALPKLVLVPVVSSCR